MQHTKFAGTLQYAIGNFKPRGGAPNRAVGGGNRRLVQETF